MSSLLSPDLKTSYNFGYDENNNPNKKPIIGYDLFPENIRLYSSIKSIKIWYGNPPDEQNIKSLLGIQVMYLNYFTGEKKMTEYQGSQITELNVETKELNIKEDDYLSKVYLGFNQFITHLKFETKNGDSIEIGNIIEEQEKNSVNDINEGRNIIMNIKGYIFPKGIRTIGFEYMPYKKFFFNRLIDLFRLRHKVQKEFKDKYNNLEEINKLNYEMKCALKICQLPDTHFSCIIKYL